MVTVAKRTVCLVGIGIVCGLSMLPSPSDACEPSDLRGHVKSVVVTEIVVDSATGKPAGVRQVLRIDISQDGSVAKTTLALARGAAGPAATSTTYFENGRPVRAIQTAKGKTVPSMTCSYDSQGRLLEARTGSEFTEFAFLDTYEYGSGFIRRRSVATPGGASVTNQTLDANGRVIKEVVIDDATSTIQRSSEITYNDNRTEVCETSPRDGRRQCVTTIKDSHGNEVELVAEGRNEKTSFEYDSTGNWISKRTSVTGPYSGKVVTIEQRKIEYW